MSREISTILVDDERKGLVTLQTMLEQYCRQVKVIATASSVADAVDRIERHEPELVFLDISLPDGTGFDVIERVRYRDFHVIFVTASDRHAVKAFGFSAIHYLLKPISQLELVEAVKRYEQIKGDFLNDHKIKILKEGLSNRHEKIILPCSEGFCMIELDQIVRIEADDNYSWFYLLEKDKILVSKSLGNFEQLLTDLPFIRIHSKHLINIRFLQKYVKGKGGYVILLDGTHLDVSESRKKEFLAKVHGFARGLG